MHHATRFPRLSAQVTSLPLSLTFASLLTFTACGDSSGDTQGTSGTPTNTTGLATSPDNTGSTQGTSSDASTLPPPGCDRSKPVTMTVTGDIKSDAVWSGVVSLEGSVSVYENAKITITPGTTIIAKAGAELEVGWNEGAAALYASGTAAQPIHFCGENANPGVWSGIRIRKNTALDSSLTHVVIEDAGTSGYVALELEAPILIDTLGVINSQGTGVVASDFHLQSRKLHISKTAVPARLVAASAVSHFPIESVLTGNQNDRVELDFSEVKSEFKMRNLGVPYLQKQTLYVTDAATWTIAPGTKYQTVAAQSIHVGWNEAASTLLWQGQLDQPIEFIAQSGSAGGWDGLNIGKNTTKNSELRHVKFKHLQQGLEINAPIKIEQVSLEDAIEGVEISSAGLAPGSSGLVVNRVKGHPVVAQLPALYSLPTNCAFAENDKNSVLVKGSEMEASGTIPKMPVPYTIESGVDVDEGAQVSIAAGTRFIMNADTKIEFGWNDGDAGIKMLGTQAEPITFEGLSPLPGYWTGLIFGPNVRADSKLEYVDVAHAGAGDRGLLDLRRSIEVVNCKLHDSAGWGIRKSASDNRDYKSTNQFSNNAKGDVGTF